MTQSEYMTQMAYQLADMSARITAMMTSMSQQLMVDREPPKPDEGSERYMTSRAAAKYIGCSEATLSLWRTSGGGPKYSRINDGRPKSPARYRQSDLDKYMAAKIK